MKRLAKDLFDRRYGELVTIGRSRLPGFAPSWTDHNAHDPGITLLELLAWVAEAQLYSLSRMRRDERAAYAALLDVPQGGTRAARGLIWPDESDPASPWKTFSSSVVIGTDALVYALNEETTSYRPTHKVLWVPAKITRLESHHSDGTLQDLTARNERGAAGYLPFSESAGSRDVLSIGVQIRGDTGLFPGCREDAKGANLVLGIRTGTASAAQERGRAIEPLKCEPPPTVTLVSGDQRFPLAIIEDSTDGLLRTGALVLGLDEVEGSPTQFSIEIQSRRGFVRPPRWLQIAPSVLPVVQRVLIGPEIHTATGEPDLSFRLEEPGLCFKAGDEDPVRVSVDEPDAIREWKRCDRLFECGPGEAVYELDESSGRITFGNGVNGRMPSPQANIRVSYAVSEGEGGNTARNRQWRVAGFAGAFGVNRDPIAGGAGRLDGIGQRREARRRVKEDRALVSAVDIVAAAKALPLLGVARAWVVPPRARTGTVTLVAMRDPGGSGGAEHAESRRWLNAIERALSGRLPLGSRLAVVAPRYVDFSVHTTFVIEQGRHPETVKQAVIETLRKQLALVPSRGAVKVRAAGVPVAVHELAAWIRGTEGVVRVSALEMVVAGGKVAKEIQVPPNGLPRINLAGSRIEPQRSTLREAA